MQQQYDQLLTKCFKNLANFTEKNKKGTIIFRDDNEEFNCLYESGREYLEKKIKTIRCKRFASLCKSFIIDRLDDCCRERSIEETNENYLHCINCESMDFCEYMEHINKASIYEDLIENKYPINFRGIEYSYKEYTHWRFVVKMRSR